MSSEQTQAIKKNALVFFLFEGHEANRNTYAIVRTPLVFTVFVVRY